MADGYEVDIVSGPIGEPAPRISDANIGEVKRLGLSECARQGLPPWRARTPL